MITVLTLCSANYLSHAKTLGNSLVECNPDCRFVIGLVDRVPGEITPDYWYPYELIPVEDLGIEAFEEMAQKYSMVELNTAVKPFYIEHLYRRNPKVSVVIYLDPDILVCSSFMPLAEKLCHYSLVVTPHSCTYDGSPTNLHYEIAMLGTGVYNLGFLGTSRTDTTFAFLNWWQKRLVDHCYYRPGTGVFVDQLWVTLAPLYFSGIHVETDPGYNMCYWNHFERCLSRQNGRYIVNGKSELVFYHFSSFDPMKPDVIANRRTQPVMTFAERPDLKPIYEYYRKLLLNAGHESVKRLPCCFDRKQTKPKRTVKTTIKSGFRSIVGALPRRLQRPLKRAAELTSACCSKCQ
ncbi:MAG: glycosyl transferase [Limisphaerales bacterium]